MAKIMLVEDDNNLREIYEARLLAEGYEIVSAKDGEEALAIAVKEKPDLIISDVMMPKISGFDMLDILRSTPETKDTKVIMMTALSQTEDKSRADKLGADRYLVKSQVTLEDVAKVARDVLTGGEAPEAVAPIVTAPIATPEPTAQYDSAPVVATPVEQVAAPEPPQATDTSIPVTVSPAPTAQPAVAPEPVQATTPVADEPTVAPSDEAAPEASQPAVGNPVSEPSGPVAPEIVEPAAPPVITPSDSSDLAQTTQDETDQAESQINEILSQAVEPESDEPLAPPPADEPALVDDSAPEPALTETLEVAPEPAEPVEPMITPQPTPITVQDQSDAEPSEEQPSVPAETDNVPVPPEPTFAASAPDTSSGQLQDNIDSAVTGGKRVIQPITDPTQKPDLNELLKQEEAKNAEPAAPVADQVVAPNPTADESQPPKNPPSGGIVSPNDIAL